MLTFELQFPATEVRALAARFSYQDDSACRAAGASARERGYYTREEFLTVCRWKTERSASKVAANDERSVREATQRALGADEEAVRMEALDALHGVGVPTASALLHFAFPGDYPILDVRALESLGVRARTVYPVSFWLDYLDACRCLAHQLDVPIRTLDKALWQHSKERGEGPPSPSHAADGTSSSAGFSPAKDTEPAAIGLSPGRSSWSGPRLGVPRPCVSGTTTVCASPSAATRATPSGLRLPRPGSWKLRVSKP